MSEEKFKICCIGSNLESRESLHFLIGNGCKIHTLITLPKGENKHVSDYCDLHDFCNEHGINVVDTKNVNSPETVEEVKSIEPDYLFTLGWSQIFKEDFINCFSKFIVGTHPSKLPYGRGRAPLPWTILEDQKTSAVSFFKIDSGVDTGKLIFQKDFEIPERTYVKDLYAKVGEELGNGFLEIYERIASGEKISSRPQDEKGVTVRGKRSPTDGFIHFDQTTTAVDRLIRAVGKPYPGAYCYYKDHKIIFWEVDLDQEGSHFGSRGQILKKNNNGILVRFADGNLWLGAPTYEDGQDVEMKFFRVGDKLGYNLQDEIHKLKQLLK
ncbi:MAG: formyltransferase family protein [Bacteroidota bacterium]